MWSITNDIEVWTKFTVFMNHKLALLVGHEASKWTIGRIIKFSTFV